MSCARGLSHRIDAKVCAKRAQRKLGQDCSWCDWGWMSRGVYLCA
nr:hypothetical protein [uncultured Campylobacter sp.]